MSVKKTWVEIIHDEGYGDALLEYININFRGKDMLAKRVVTIQEIIDVIEAEEKKIFAETAKIKLGSPRSVTEVVKHIAYVNGLRFAMELVEKAKEVTE